MIATFYYSIFYFLNIKSNNYIIVQQESFKQMFCNRYKIDTNKILVSGVSIVKKTNKSQDGEQQSFSYNESHIDYSNVMYYDGSNSNGSKIGFKISSDGNKSRFFKKSGLLLS